MNESTKCRLIDSAQRLLQVFLEVFQVQVDKSTRIRVQADDGGPAELYVECAHRKCRLEVWPRLNPSRKLVHARAESERKSVLLLCPHIPDGLAADLRSAGINHADLNGRLFLKVPSLIVDRGPRGKGYRGPGPELNPFTLKSSRVVRMLLASREREWTQEDLQTGTGISRALVSLTLADLIERELVEQTRPCSRDQAGLYRVGDFNRLLDAWSAEDRWHKRTVVRQYSALSGDPSEIAASARDAMGVQNLYFTQWFAAQVRCPYTTSPLVSAYVRNKPSTKIPWAREVDNGGNLWLITPRDEGVFQGGQTIGGFNLVSDVQIYLDLLRVGQRGPEQAQALREWEGFVR